MPRRYTSSQIQSAFRRVETQRRQAIQKYNREVQQYNQKIKRAIDEHNREVRQRRQKIRRAIDQHNQDVRAYNRQVQANRNRINHALQQLRHSNAAARSSIVHTSSQALNNAYTRLQEQVRTTAPSADYEALFGYAEQENANSLDLANVLLGGSTETEIGEGDIAETAITAELAEIDPDLDQRWRGALHALSPNNPDAARQFCTSAREIITMILHGRAPDSEVLAGSPNCEKDEKDKPTRRSRIHYCLQKKGIAIDALETFVEVDIDNVIDLFGVLNKGTHGRAGRYNLTQLMLIKQRVEDAILFLFKIVS